MNSITHRNPINLLRGTAVLLVFSTTTCTTPKPTWALSGTYGGLLGVQLFFLFSGYLNVKTGNQHSWPSFMRGHLSSNVPGTGCAASAQIERQRSANQALSSGNEPNRFAPASIHQS